MSDQRRVELFANLFPPNPFRHGIMHHYDADTGRKQVHTVAERTTLGLIKTHLELNGHKGRLGYLPGTEEGTTSGEIDIDLKAYGEHFDQVVRDVKEVLSLAGVTWYSETSTNGGNHIWIFTDQPVSYEHMYYFLRAFTDEAGHPELETYPSSPHAGVAGRWILLPYAGAANDPEGLGLTYLTDRHGQSIPIDLLNNVVTNPAETIIGYASIYQAKTQAEDHQDRQLDTAKIRDLDPQEAFEALRKAVMNPPLNFPRHDSIISFINLADRAGRAEDMVELLKREEVYREWVTDGSRNYQTWLNEVERWAERWESDRDKLIPKHGIKHLLDNGWELGKLKRSTNQLLTTGLELNKLPEKDLSEGIAELLEEQEVHWAYDSARVMAYRYDGKTWVAVPYLHEERIKRDVEKVLRSGGKQLSEARLNAVYRKLERNELEKPLNATLEEDLIACDNGLFNWRTLELEEFDHRKVTIGRVNAAWDISLDEQVGAWQEFLAEALKGQGEREKYIEILQEYVGYALTRRMYMRSILELHGPSSTGKTTAWRVLMGVLGDLSSDPTGIALSTTSDVFEGQDWGVHFIAPTLVVVDEINTGGWNGRKVITNLKTLAGGGEIYVNPKGRASSTVKSNAKLLLCTNEDLRLHEDAANDAVFRRLVRIPFENIVAPTEERPRLDRAILADPLERNRIFKWAVVGLRRLAEQNWALSHPELRYLALEEARRAANPIIEFLERRCWVGEGTHKTEVVVMYREFVEWALEEGHTGAAKMGVRLFGRKLKTALETLGWDKEVRRIVGSGKVQAAWVGLYLREAD